MRLNIENDSSLRRVETLGASTTQGERISTHFYETTPFV